jgi:bifunctional DNase/RNase
MAQTILISAGNTARPSATISLASGIAMPISIIGQLTGSEQVYLMHSSDNGATFQKTSGELNNYGVILDSNTNRCTLVGDGDSAPFKIGVTDTAASVVIKGG